MLFDQSDLLFNSKKHLDKKCLDYKIMVLESLERKEVTSLHNDLSTNFGLVGGGLMYQDSDSLSLIYTKKNDNGNKEFKVNVEQIAIDKYYISIAGNMTTKFSEGYISKDKVGPTILQYFRELVGHE